MLPIHNPAIPSLALYFLSLCLGDHIITRPEYEHEVQNKAVADFIFDYFDSKTDHGGKANDGVLEETLLEPYFRDADTNRKYTYTCNDEVTEDGGKGLYL